MAAVTLATIVARARERADQPVAGFIPDSATGSYAYVNEGVQKIYERLTTLYEDYFESSSTWTSTGVSDIALPADFFKLLGIDLNLSGQVISLTAMKRGERNAYRNTQYLYRGAPKYQVTGSNLRILPAPAAGTSGTIWYVPQAPTLALTSDTINLPSGWERYVVLYTAIQMKMKQEDDTRELRIELEKMENELTDMASNRDAGQPRHATDLDLVDADPRFY